MTRYGKRVLQTMPFLRLLAALIVGILAEYYAGLGYIVLTGALLAAAGLMVLYRLLPSSFQFSYRWLSGVSIFLLVGCCGSRAVYLQDIRHRADWVGHHLTNARQLVVQLQEPLTGKTHYRRTVASVPFVDTGRQAPHWLPVCGTVLLYFRKDSCVEQAAYGSQLVVRKKIAPIVNRQGSDFDYRRYQAFRGIHHQVWLKASDYTVLPTVKRNRFINCLVTIRAWVVHTLQEKIPGEKEAGMAAALVIGYKNELDKDLLQAYSDTGVVHIIAISGMHLALIYGLLLFMLQPLRRSKGMRRVHAAVILLALWGFSLLTGAAPSILRAAVMFSFLIAAEVMGRKTSSYNTLAASAFCLLVYNPYYLWDIGFQLSYTAVLGIMAYMGPLYRSLYIRNPLLRMVWRLNAVTLSAQVLTFPLLLYHFHRFPNLFLFSNLFAVPLSALILYGCLAVLLLAPVPVLSHLSGSAVAWLIGRLNGLVARTGELPFAVTDTAPLALTQTIALYLCIICCSFLFIRRRFAQ